MIGNVLNILNMNESCHNGSYNWLPTRDSALCLWVKAPLVKESTSLTSNKSTIFVIGHSRMCLSSLLPLFPLSNFMLRTTPLSSEFVPTTLHIGQWFCVVKSVFSSTMSPMQKFLDILTHLWCSWQCPDKFLFHLLQNSLLRCWILLHLVLQYKSGFWKTPGGDITIFVFIVSILFRGICIGLCPSLIVSTVKSIYYCSFRHKCLEWFLIQAVSMCL